MSKKAKDETETLDEVTAAEVEAVAEVKPAKPWTETTWGTHARWACRLCPFDTLDGEEAMAEHYLVEHAPPPAPAPAPVVQVYDRFGNPVR
ncbi:MAG: hypothetical protein IPK78_18090 [Rhodospirillales bacterium]|nr:hypothetical protein [Rhodospirillales bacterium]